MPRLVLLVMTWSCITCFGWSNKEHIQLTRIAVERLLADPSTPDAFGQWLRHVTPGLLDMAGEEQFFLHQTVGESARGYEGLLHWATEPDARATRDPRNKLVESFGIPERKLHFVDLELLWSAGRRLGYRDDLSGKPSLNDIPPDPADPHWKEAGMLPFRVQQCYQKLVECFRDGKLQPAFDGDEDHAIRWAGYLAHYLEDNTQPQHATVDYKSQSYFKDRRHAPNVHAEMEYRMVDEGRGEFLELRREYWPLFVTALDLPDPIQTKDLWRATLEVSLLSYDALPLIGHAARQATGSENHLNTAEFFHYQEDLHGRPITVMQMKARQTAWAVIRAQRLLLMAWNESRGN
jgi:hypothetical protein